MIFFCRNNFHSNSTLTYDAGRFRADDVPESKGLVFVWLFLSVDRVDLSRVLYECVIAFVYVGHEQIYEKVFFLLDAYLYKLIAVLYIVNLFQFGIQIWFAYLHNFS